MFSATYDAAIIPPWMRFSRRGTAARLAPKPPAVEEANGYSSRLQTVPPGEIPAGRAPRKAATRFFKPCLLFVRVRKAGFPKAIADVICPATPGMIAAHIGTTLIGELRSPLIL